MSIIEDLRNLEKIDTDINKINSFYVKKSFFRVFDGFNFNLKKSLFGSGKVNSFFRVNILPVLKDEEFVSRNDCGIWFTALLNYFHEEFGLRRVVIVNADQKFFKKEFLFTLLNAKKLKVEIKQYIETIGHHCAMMMKEGSVVFGDVGSVGEYCANAMNGGSLVFGEVGSVGNNCATYMRGGSLVFGDVKGNIGDGCAHSLIGGSLVFGDVRGSVGKGCADSMFEGSVVFGSVRNVERNCAIDMKGGKLVFNGDIFSYVENVYSEKEYLGWVEDLFKSFNEKGIKVDKKEFEFHEASHVTIFNHDFLLKGSTFARGKSGVFFSRKFSNKIAKWFEKEDSITIIRKLDFLGLEKYYGKNFYGFLICFLGIVYNSLNKQDAEKFLINIEKKLDSEDTKLMLKMSGIKHTPIVVGIQKKYK